MYVTVNGTKREYHGTMTLTALLEQMNAVPEQVATMVNDQVVPRERRQALPLKDGDRVEVLTFAGGG